MRPRGDLIRTGFVISVTLFMILLISSRAAAQDLSQTCSHPSFPAVVPTVIDSQCGASGSGTGPEAAQNQTKNNFCAPGSADQITIDRMASLQVEVQNNTAINFGDENNGARKKGPTANRDPLRDLGEGKLVVMQGYVLKARQEGGESVNCGKDVPNQASFHDIHISIVPDSATQDECSGVVVEMSPHHRPVTWNIQTVQKLAGSKTLVRVTGQLLFDSSHVPCNGGVGVRSNPKRVSLWEIHPIYGFEVCTSDCSTSPTWVSLDAWTKSE
jgi:hypothetical protein